MCIFLLFSILKNKIIILENHEKQLELFKNMNWVHDEKDNIISNSMMFGGQGKQALQE